MPETSGVPTRTATTAPKKRGRFHASDAGISIRSRTGIVTIARLRTRNAPTVAAIRSETKAGSLGAKNAGGIILRRTLGQWRLRLALPILIRRRVRSRYLTLVRLLKFKSKTPIQ